MILESSIQIRIMSIKKKTAKRKPGRPTTFTTSLGEKICRRLSMGDVTIKALCELTGMPTRQTLHNWTLADVEFFGAFARARALATFVWEEELRELVDGAEATAKAFSGEKGAGAVVQAIKLRADTYRYLMSRHNPDFYGDRSKLELTGKGGGPVEVAQSVGLSKEDEQEVARIRKLSDGIALKVPTRARLGCNGNGN